MPKRILLVEDYEPLRERLTSFMRDRLGQEVTAVGDGLAAWGLLQVYPFDVVLTDIELPHLSGIELLERIRGRGNEVRVIITSEGYDPSMAHAKAREHGALFMPKPIDLAVLSEELGRE